MPGSGSIEGDTSDQGTGEAVRVPLSGGVPVYEREVHSKRLVGFKRTTDWDALSEVIVTRGYGRGNMFDLPALDE